VSIPISSSDGFADYGELGQCIRRKFAVSGGFVEYVSHHEWVVYPSPAMVQFWFCRFCLAIVDEDGAQSI
jgi:hypothetical protein